MMSFVRGASFVVRAASLQGPLRRMANRANVAVSDRIVTIPLASCSIRARMYCPIGRSRQTVLFVSGLHPSGIDEPRLVALVRELARSGLTVITPDIPELRRFEIAPQLTDRIEQTAVWVAGARDLAPAGRIGLMGVSFSGGLSIVAAGRDTLRDRLLYVLSLGGHDDLARVLEYLCTGMVRDLHSSAVAPPPPHEYGAAVVLLHVADAMVPLPQVGLLDDALRRFLDASAIETTDPPAATRQFSAVRELTAQLPSPSSALLALVNDRDVARLGPLLLPHIASHADWPALSPSKSPPPTAPVFLLHGQHDTIIPSCESSALAARLRGRVPLRVLITDLISHAETDRSPGVRDVVQLAAFWGGMLGR